MNSTASFFNTEHQSLSNFLFFRFHDFCFQSQVFNIIFFHIALNFMHFIELINSFADVARIIPHTPGKGYINLKILTSFSQKYTPYHCNYFCENGFHKNVQLTNI